MHVLTTKIKLVKFLPWVVVEAEALSHAAQPAAQKKGEQIERCKPLLFRHAPYRRTHTHTRTHAQSTHIRTRTHTHTYTHGSIWSPAVKTQVALPRLSARLLYLKRGATKEANGHTKRWLLHLTCTVSLRVSIMVFTVCTLSVRMRRSRGPRSVSIWRSRQVSGPAFLLRRLEGSHFLMTSYGKVLSSCTGAEINGEILVYCVRFV